MNAIAVTGAAGRLGRQVVSLLCADERDVVAVARRPVPVPLGATAGVADYDDPPALRAVLASVETLVLISSDGEAERVLQHHLNVVTAAAGTGVGHIVVLSSVDSDRASPLCYAQVNALTEQAVRDSDVAHTIVRASIYTEFLASLCTTARVAGTLRLPAADGRIGLVARSDVGRCLAACALRAPTGGPLDVTGPQRVTLTDLAAHLGLAYEPVSEREFLRHLAGQETPWWSYAYASMFASVREQRWDTT